jgi:hypothetical protein
MKRSGVMAVLLFAFAACHKSGQGTRSIPVSASYYGRWQWINSSFGPSTTYPSGSIVVLDLEAGNQYQATLNGLVATSGTFGIDSSANGVVLQFNNINQPVGNNTSGQSGGVNFIAFNFLRIGQLILFQYNSTSTPGDTLSLLQYPITPEATISLFKRM